MDPVLREEFSLAEFMLVEAKDSLREAKYGDAEAFARTALGSFLLFQDDTEFFQRAFQGVHEASGIAIEARRLWIESGQLPSPETIDKLRDSVRAETEEFFQDIHAAVQAAMSGSPLVR